MENRWPKEKAQKHIGYLSYLIVISGILTMFDSFRRFSEVGISAFIMPYFYNILDFLFGMFEIYVGVVLRKLKIWTKWATLIIIVLKLLFDLFFDFKEFMIMCFVLYYYLYIFKNAKAGWLFER